MAGGQGGGGHKSQGQGQGTVIRRRRAEDAGQTGQGAKDEAQTLTSGPTKSPDADRANALAAPSATREPLAAPVPAKASGADRAAERPAPRSAAGAGTGGGFSGGGNESFASLFEAGPRVAAVRVRVHVGAELDVTVVQIGKDAVFVGLDEKREGFIEAADLLSKEGELTVKVGSRLRARVIELEGRPGAVRLAPLFLTAPRGEGRDEARAEEPSPGTLASPSRGAVAVGATVRGTVAGVERFGVFVQLAAPSAGPAPSGSSKGHGRGVRGLVPVVELGVPRGSDLHKMFPVGTELSAKVIAVDEQGRIRLSVIALAADEERRSFEEEKAKLNPAGGRERSFGTLGDLLAKRLK